MVLCFPYRSGISRQGAPVRNCQSMPLIIRRWSAAGCPVQAFCLGSKGWSFSHCLSIKSPLLPSPKELLLLTRSTIFPNSTFFKIHQFADTPYTLNLFLISQVSPIPIFISSFGYKSVESLYVNDHQEDADVADAAGILFY